MPAFELIEHTADIGIRAFGATEAEVFQNTAAGMFSLICEPERILDSRCLEISVSAEGHEALLVEWLNELLYLHDSHSMLFSRFMISEMTESTLEARACGENIDFRRHQLMTDVKAATYHMLKLLRTGDGWTAEVIFDV